MIDLPGVQSNVILAPYTTYKIGGPAEYFFVAKSSNDLILAVTEARKSHTPYFILGTGANILILDQGIRGLVILNHAHTVEFLPDHKVRAESGAVMADLIVACRDRGLSGLEHFTGIPSSVGGALWQNLHFLSPDRERTVFIEEVLTEATILDEKNTVHTVDKGFFAFGYDDSILHHRPIVVLDAMFQMAPKPKEEIQAQMDANLAWRRSKQPQLDEYPSCGSVFKKIEGVGAGRLIDQAGLKGTIIGGAQISPKHANFIVNLGHATAADVLDLIGLVQLEVRRKLGYELETEISIVGEK